MSVEENKAVVRRLIDAWNTRNWAVFDELMVPDNIYHYGVTGEMVGREALKQEVIGGRNAFPDAQWAIEDMIGEGDKVVVRLTFSGTHRGEYMGIAPTNKRMTIGEVIIARIVSGKFVEEWDFGDELGGLKQLGVVTIKTASK